MTSGYLSIPVRTLREACREIAAAHPERLRRKCGRCGLRRLCVRLERNMRRKARRRERS